MTANSSAASDKVSTALPVLGDESLRSSLVLVHGGPGMDASYFFPYLEPLASSMRIVPVTSGHSGASTLDRLTDEIHDAIRGEGARRVFLLGHSFGGALALEYVRRHGQAHLAGLVRVAAIHDASWMSDFGRLNPDYREPSIDQELEPSERMRQSVVADAALYFDPEWLDEGRRALGRIRYNPSLAAALAEAYMGTCDAKDVLASLDLPSLAIAGGRDRVVSDDHTKAGSALVRGEKRIVLAGSGHFPFIDDAGSFTTLIRDFVARERQRQA